MKIENDKIIQATEDELYSYWLSRGWDDIYPFPEYMQRMKDTGCEVIEETLPTLFDHITESPEVLAEKLVYPSENFKVREWDAEKEDWTEPHGFWRSTLIPNRDFNTKSEAVAATVEKLKEVCEDTR